MHNNEFERKVQQQMEEFRLPPSDAVWLNVQDGIRKEKRRRIWRYVPAAAALLLLVPGYLLFVHTPNPALKANTAKTTSTVNSEKNSQAAVNPSTNIKNHLNDSNLYTQPGAGSVIKEENKNANGKDALVKGSLNDESGATQSTSNASVENTAVATKPNTTGTAKTNAPDAEKNKGNKAVSTGNVASSAALLAGSTHNKNAAGKRSVTSNNAAGKDDLTNDNAGGSSANNLAKNNNKHQNNIKRGDKNNLVNATNNIDHLDNVVLIVPANDNVVIDEDLRHAMVPAVAFNASPKVSAPAIAVPETKPIQVVRPSTWSWGIQATPGMSNITKTYATTENVMNTAQMAFAAGPYQRGNSYVVPYSQPNNGTAFSIGMFAKKAIRKVSVEVGMNYSYYSAAVKVGAKQDSTAVVRLQNMTLLSANTFYQAGKDYTYHNKYHLIEIPVTVAFHMFHMGDANVVGTVGGTLAYMVDGKMLFRNSYGTHFENNTLINRTQIFLNAGIGVEFNERGRLPVTIGPVVSYGVTRLAKPATSTSQHLVSLGLKTSFQLQKLFK
ncbi:hypothetical protein [Pinibacter aurantiacus]|uniref:PorT family protein n=1 Tax=Pinibacter aurantiacus TaxID=2851599 RepID=A0A9E2S9K5_9BACT|nr:hypothetical protein [Pinibacter aurantiacus]MBV4358436.1 hypothetical protein [Pinibacter aurantiacus]